MKRVLSLALAACLMLSVFTGCHSGIFADTVDPEDIQRNPDEIFLTTIPVEVMAVSEGAGEHEYTITVKNMTDQEVQLVGGNFSYPDTEKGYAVGGWNEFDSGTVKPGDTYDISVTFDKDTTRIYVNSIKVAFPDGKWTFCSGCSADEYFTVGYTYSQEAHDAWVMKMAASATLSVSEVDISDDGQITYLMEDNVHSRIEAYYLRFEFLDENFEVFDAIEIQDPTIEDGQITATVTPPAHDGRMYVRIGGYQCLYRSDYGPGEVYAPGVQNSYVTVIDPGMDYGEAGGANASGGKFTVTPWGYGESIMDLMPEGYQVAASTGSPFALVLQPEGGYYNFATIGFSDESGLTDDEVSEEIIMVAASMDANDETELLIALLATVYGCDPTLSNEEIVGIYNTLTEGYGAGFAVASTVLRVNGLTYTYTDGLKPVLLISAR